MSYDRETGAGLDILVDETHALMDRDAFDGLLEYSCTLPSGTTIGKRWRRREPYMISAGVPSEWFLGEYVKGDEPGRVGIIWRRILIA